MSTVDALLKDPLSASPEDLERMLSETDDGEEGTTDETVGEDVEAEAPEGDEAATPPAAEPEKEVPAPVATRDGKNHIPYSVLETARRTASEARQAASAAQQLADQERAQRQVLERQLAELNAAKTALQEGAATAKPVEQIVAVDKLAAQLAALREDGAPDLADMIETLAGQVKAAQDEARASKEAAERSQQQLQEDRARRVQEQVERAIGNVPKLVYVREEKPETFNAIVEIDDWARSQPAFKGLSLEARFAKSIAMYEAAHGVIELPGSAKPVVPDVSAAAAAAIAKASRATVPNTLSDIPGGELPAKSEAEALESMNALDLQQKILGMDDKAIDKLLASLSR